MPTPKQTASDNYSTLGCLVSQGWSGEVRQGASGYQGRGRAVPMRSHHWNSSHARAQQWYDSSQGISLYKVLWRKERITAKANREHWEHLSMACFYFCSQEAMYQLHVPNENPELRVFIISVPWLCKLANLLYRKLTYFRNTIFLILIVKNKCQIFLKA